MALIIPQMQSILPDSHSGEATAVWVFESPFAPTAESLPVSALRKRPCSVGSAHDTAKFLVITLGFLLCRDGQREKESTRAIATGGDTHRPGRDNDTLQS